jgi:vacuolar protein sorting-associated protein 13A/C
MKGPRCPKRELKPWIGHDSTIQYTVSARPEGAAQALVTIDSPQVVLAVDPLYALTEFAVAPFKSEVSKEVPSSDNDDKPQDEPTNKTANESSLSYRVEVRHSTVLILASDTDPKSQAIELSIKDVVVAQQVRVFAITILKLSVFQPLIYPSCSGQNDAGST